METDGVTYRGDGVIDIRVAALESALEDMCYQFAYNNNKGEIHTGGLSALENAFAVLGWTDPQPLPKEMLCDEPKCKKRATCGIPTASGYKRLCGEHYQKAEKTK